MKNKTAKSSVTPTREPTEDEIRDYAYHLYQQSGCKPGHDLDHWLEAKACLECNVPPQHTRMRLHRHRHGVSRPEVTIITLEPSAGKPPVTGVEQTALGVKAVLAPGRPRK